MIADIVLTIIGWIFNVFVYLLPSWSFWQNNAWQLNDVFITIGNAFGKLNFIFAIDTAFSVLDYLLQFEAYFLTAVVLGRVISMIRKGEKII